MHPPSFPHKTRARARATREPGSARLGSVRRLDSMKSNASRCDPRGFIRHDGSRSIPFFSSDRDGERKKGRKKGRGMMVDRREERVRDWNDWRFVFVSFFLNKYSMFLVSFRTIDG